MAPTVGDRDMARASKYMYVARCAHYSFSDRLSNGGGRLMRSTVIESLIRREKGEGECKSLSDGVKRGIKGIRVMVKVLWY